MRIPILVFLLVLALLAPAGASNQSIQPLSAEGYDDGKPFCTAFSINKQHRLWITAFHCLAEVGEDKQVTWWKPIIGKTPAAIVRHDHGLDLMILQGGLPATALELDEGRVREGTQVEVEGYSRGAAVMFFGRVGTPSFQREGDARPVMVVGMSVWGGMSGAPITSRGRVVSVCQAVRLAPAPASVSVTQAQLKSFAGDVWEK